MTDTTQEPTLEVTSTPAEGEPGPPPAGTAEAAADPVPSSRQAVPPSTGPRSVPGGASPGAYSSTGEASDDPVVAAKAEADRAREQLLRMAADFDNFRKRARREVEDAKRAGREELLRELLPVFDNLERGIQSAQRATEVKGVADGLSMVHKQFEGTLQRIGIARVPGVGAPFDPAVHEAIQQVETADHAPGTVIAEVQPGYTQGERLVRAALVVVSRAPANGAGEGAASAQEDKN